MLRRFLPLALAFATLAACGQSAQPAAGGAAPTAAATIGATAAQPGPTVAAPAEATAVSGPFAGIEQGVTPEGYHTLGSAGAPVTLVMYSDFL